VNAVPAAFRRRFAAHNRSCWLAAAASLGAAWLAWLFVFALYTAVVLVFETVRTGNVDLARPPWWYLPLAVALAGAMLVATAARRWIRRFRPPPDRPIIGWHLLPETLMLPAAMTFAIWDHLGARVVFRREEWAEAWQVLKLIFSTRRAPASQLGQWTGDSLPKVLLGLQLTGLIDLHQGEDDWFYRVPSDEEPTVAAMLADEEGAAEPTA
jgi:hypothetical protein